MHDLYLLAENCREPQVDVWVQQINTQANWLYTTIDDHLRKTTSLSPQTLSMSQIEPDIATTEQRNQNEKDDDDRSNWDDIALGLNTGAIPKTSSLHAIQQTSSSNELSTSSVTSLLLE